MALPDALAFVAAVKSRFQARPSRGRSARAGEPSPAFAPSRVCGRPVRPHAAFRPQREPRTAAAFLELLAAYRADEAGAVETHAAVARLFRRNTDLADDFARFLPADVAPQPRQQRAAR